MAIFNRQEHRKIRKYRSKKLSGNLQKPRVVISKSNRYLTAQAIDDSTQKTLVYICTRSLGKADSGESLKLNYKSREWAQKLGAQFAKVLTDKGIDSIVFDRNGYVYHGKVQAFCEEMRKLGINF